MKLYGLKNCDTCKKALSQLRAAGHDIDFFDIRTEPLGPLQIADLLARHGEQIVLNRKSTTWRNLHDSDRLLPLDDHTVTENIRELDIRHTDWGGSATNSDD
mgnify:CR=1 FL=1